MTNYLFWILLIAIYLISSLPLSSWLAHRFYDIELTGIGSGNTGASNLAKATSKSSAVPAALFDIAKGIIPVWIGYSLGFGPVEEIIVGLAAIAGHNWPVFLRFNGGRGIITSLAVIIALPAVNGKIPWEIILFILIAAITLSISRSVPVCVVSGMIAVPITGWVSGRSTIDVIGLIVIVLILFIRRLTAPIKQTGLHLNTVNLIFNRRFLIAIFVTVRPG